MNAALDNAITALGQCQKGTARQFLESAIRTAAAVRQQEWVDDYVGINKICDEHASKFSDTLHANEIDSAIRMATIQGYELARKQYSP